MSVELCGTVPEILGASPILELLQGRNEIFYWSLANVVLALAVMAIFSYRRLYRRFYFLPPYFILTIGLSVIEALMANRQLAFRINWIAEIGLAVLAGGCLLEQCYFQLRFREFRVALWCLASAALCWWGERGTRHLSTLFGLPRWAFWLTLLVHCLTIGLFILFLSLVFRKRLPIPRPLYVSGVFFGLGLVTSYLLIGSLAGLVLRQSLEPTGPLVSCQIRLIGAGFLLFVFCKKEPRWEPPSRELLNRMSQYIASSADHLARATDALGKERSELAGLLSPRTSAELDGWRSGSNRRVSHSSTADQRDDDAK